MKTEVTHLNIANIVPWDKNPRKYFDEKAIKELACSIEEVGVLEPVLVRLTEEDYGEGATYCIVAGERRYRAASLAGLEYIPSIIMLVDEKQALEIAIIENLQRTDVHPLDEAQGFVELLKQDYDEKALSVKFGVAESTVAQRIKLLDLTPELQKLFYSGKIKMGHALLICRLQEKAQKECLVFMNNNSDEGEIPTVAVLNSYIKEDIFMALDKVAFDTKDANLVKKCGACEVCPKRSGANKLLFEDIEKGDVCLDRVCFDKKYDAHIDKKYEEAIKDNLLIVGGWNGGTSAEKLSDKYPGVIFEYSGYSESTKKAGGLPAFCVGGNDKGKIIYVKLDKNKTRKASKDGVIVTPVAEQIANIKTRIARNKELDAEKIYTAAVEKAEKVIFPAPKNYMFGTLFDKMFMLFLYEDSSMDVSEGMVMLEHHKKKGSFGSISQKQEDEYVSGILEGKIEMRPEVYNLFIQEMVYRYRSVKGTNLLQKAIMNFIFKEYNELIGYDAIVKVIADKAAIREERHNKQIKLLKENGKKPAAEKKEVATPKKKAVTKPAKTPTGKKLAKKKLETLVS